MTYDLFVKSYKKDFPWLKNCLRSVSEKCHGFRNLVIVVPMQDLPEISTWGLTRETVVGFSEPEGLGYTIQQCVKLDADKYSDADFITYLDSDLYFTRECSPEMLMNNGKPVVYMTDWKKWTDPYGITKDVPWKPGSEHIVKQKVQYEFMRRHPFTYPRWLLKSFKEYVKREFGYDHWQYFLNGKFTHPMSEFNLLGSFAYVFYNGKFEFIDTESVKLPEPFVHQFWSHGGPGHKDNHDMLLKHGLTIT
jgi:hypothetical protein